MVRKWLENSPRPLEWLGLTAIVDELHKYVRHRREDTETAVRDELERLVGVGLVEAKNEKMILMPSMEMVVHRWKREPLDRSLPCSVGDRQAEDRCARGRR